jgi:hypothetical protein
MATPKPPKNLAAYNKELRRIERFMRSAEQRGFTFLTDIPEQKAKPTKRDVERLKKLTPEKLYSRAYYTDDSGNQVPASPQRGGKWMPTKSGQITVGGKKQNYQAAMRAAYKRMARAQAERRESKEAQRAVAKREAEQARQEARAASYQNIIDNLKDPLIAFTPSYRWDDVAKQTAIQYHNFFERVLNAAESELGAAELARRIQNNGVELQEIIDEMLYKYYHTAEEARFNLNRFVRLIMGKDANLADYSPGKGETLAEEAEYYTAADGSSFSNEYAVRGMSGGYYDAERGAPVDTTLEITTGASDMIRVQGGVISMDDFLRGGGVMPFEKPG